MTAALIAFARVSWLSWRILSVKRTGKTVVHSCAHGIARYQRDDAAKAVHQAQQIDLFADEIEFDTRATAPASAETSVTRPREAGLKMVALNVAICAPSALHDVLLCAAIYMSLGGAAGSPDE